MTTTVIWDPRRSRPLSNVTSPGPISTATSRLGVSNALHASQAPKALMQEVPVLTEPFEKVAIDLAGPFERAASGYRFLLTAIDLATRYPEAIPLKSATAEEVAEGLLEIFSRHGLPREILSDQGAQLTGKVMNQLCAKLHIKRITTTPSHPAANGCVERLHGTVVPMLRKAISSHLHWPKQVKLCLFALRSVPNRSTRYSPFELLYGRGMNSPIDLVAGEWEKHPTTTVNIPRWMEQLCQRLDVFRASARENGLEARAKSKAHYYRNTKTRDIPERSMVLLRTPGMAGKLEEAWSGPYEVLCTVSPVNIEIGLPGRDSKRKRVVHTNHVKLFNQPEYRVLCEMIVAED